MWKVLGARYHKQIAFGALKDANVSIAESPGLPPPPSGENAKSRVVVWQNDEDPPTVCEGERNSPHLPFLFIVVVVLPCLRI